MTEERDLVLREATTGDLAELLRLLAQLFEHDTPRPDAPTDEERRALEVILADGCQTLVVVEDEGRIVASAVFVLVPNLTHGGRPYAILENVVVDAGERGRGIGEMLVRHLVERARQAGCYKVALTSNKRRTDAHRFYRRLGFEATHEGFRIGL